MGLGCRVKRCPTLLGPCSNVCYVTCYYDKGWGSKHVVMWAALIKYRKFRDFHSHRPYGARHVWVHGDRICECIELVNNPKIRYTTIDECPLS